MNPKNVLEILSRLRVLPMFPNDEGVLESLLILCGAMCRDESQVDWLVRRMTSGLYAQWPGPQEMRACLSSKFLPKDGISICSSVYPEGIPSERVQTRKAIQGAPAKLLTGETAPSTSDEALAAAVQIASETIQIRNVLSGPATKAEIAAAPEWLRRLEGYES